MKIDEEEAHSTLSLDLGMDNYVYNQTKERDKENNNNSNNKHILLTFFWVYCVSFRLFFFFLSTLLLSNILAKNCIQILIEKTKVFQAFNDFKFCWLEILQNERKKNKKKKAR
jgi:hypothetical protein